VRRALAGALLAALCCALPAGVAAQENFHVMTLPDGKVDESKCGACHRKDMRLAANRLETCLACHARSEHSGTLEHLRVDAGRVAEAMRQRPADGVAMPLAEDGRIWCGTCHLFHDPKVRGEAWLERGWLPPDGGLPGAVRQSVIERWSAIAASGGAKEPIGEFAAHGTRMLRLPVAGGTLCAQCHAGVR